jgi:hypothetical protein
VKSVSLVETMLADRASSLGRFDRVQLEDVLSVCREARTLSDAGRTLFAVSRTTKSSTNDADRCGSTSRDSASTGRQWPECSIDQKPISPDTFESSLLPSSHHLSGDSSVASTGGNPPNRDGPVLSRRAHALPM